MNDVYPNGDSGVVSVLLAAYSSAHLREALGSVLNQSHRELELVVIDDSPDDSVGELVASFADPRVVYLRNPSNLGTALSYRRAIEAASGEYAAVINDDDLWEPDFVAELLAGLRRFPEAVVAFSDHWVLRDGERDASETDRVSAVWGRSTLSPGLHMPFQRVALIDKAVSIAVAALFRREAVLARPIPGAVGGAYDLFLAYVLCRTGAGAVYVDHRLASWRVHDRNLTHVPSCARAEENAEVLRVMVEDPALSPLRPELSRSYATSLWTVATRHLLAGSDRRALVAILTALRLGHGRSALLLPGLLLPRGLRRELAWWRRLRNRRDNGARRSTLMRRVV